MKRRDDRPYRRSKASVQQGKEAEKLGREVDDLIYGQGGTAPGQDDSVIAKIASRISAAHTSISGGDTLEVMARLKQETLLDTPIDGAVGAAAPQRVGAKVSSLKDILDQVDSSLMLELFQGERSRLEDYGIYAQIYELITQAGEAIQTYCDNVISPDDFSKMDLTVAYDGAGASRSEVQDRVKTQCSDLTATYHLSDRIEQCILTALTKGDAFMCVLNLRQELEGLLRPTRILSETTLDGALAECNVPAAMDPDVTSLVEEIRADEEYKDAAWDAPAVSHYINSLVELADPSKSTLRMGVDASFFASDVTRRIGGSRRRATDPGESDAGRLSKVMGSVIRIIDPENVIKLSQDDTTLGYFYVENITTQGMPDFARKGMSDQAAIVRAIDNNLSSRILGSTSSTVGNARDRLVGRIIGRTLASKLGNHEFLSKNQGFARDAYNILRRARAERQKVRFVYIAPDQMVHFTPDGSTSYGDSVLSRVKFLAKLYLGALTNAFMRNSIRRPERLVWYLDVGMDNEGDNSIQEFIRTIKQREVKFSNLKDITTTINHVGEFHDFYVPTFDGNRPIEVETINMGGPAEVDSPFLEYLRKAIIAGMGVPAAFVGYSEEIAFARSLTMDNGRFLRRVVRLQKHFGAAASTVYRLAYRNEYQMLEKLIGTEKDKDGGVDGERKKEGEEDDIAVLIEPHRISVRLPSPATLNLTNVGDAITQAQSVVDFVVTSVAVGESDEVKSDLQRLVVRDFLPQINWERYDDMLVEARINAARRKAGESAGGSAGGEEAMA